MTRSILIVSGWVGATALLYVTLVGLELYWNIFSWRPRLDPEALGLLFVMFSALIAIRLLVRITLDHLSQWVSLLLCAGLFALALYVLPPEPLTEGLLGRLVPSPLWYRGGRFVVMVLPLSFWAYALLRRRKTASQSVSAPGAGPMHQDLPQPLTNLRR